MIFCVRFALVAVVLVGLLTGKVNAQELIPVHPVIGNVEAVSAGDYGEALIDVRYVGPNDYPSANEGAFRLQFYDINGAPIGNEVIVQNTDIRLFQEGPDDWLPWTSVGGSFSVSSGQVVQIRVGSYIRDAGPAAYCFEVRAYNDFPSPWHLVATTRSDPDGLPSADGSDLLDRRYQIIRERGLLLSATNEASTDGHGLLRLTFSSVSAGPLNQVPAPLRVSPTSLSNGAGVNTWLESSVDTDPRDLLPSDFEIIRGGTQVTPLTSLDVSSISVLPGSNQVLLRFDPKSSRLGGDFSVRLSPLSHVRDGWGQRLRSNSLYIASTTVCQGIPQAFALYEPLSRAVALQTPISFSWTPAACAPLGYRFEIASDVEFLTIVYSFTTGATSTHATSNELQHSTHYWWRVTALGTQGETQAVNGPFSFATAVPGDANADGRVNGADLSILLANFGISATIP